jgi:A/G-specific adenine glycosylase
VQQSPAEQIRVRAHEESDTTVNVDTARMARALSDWFVKHQRALPWRVDRTPYRVWLSEVMLQQTRVTVVTEYYQRFVARFPDVAALARASEDEVLSLWSGLGYYSRGRSLHRAAHRVVALHGGRFPSTSEGLASLPGIGPYTAAAVASLAFGERCAVVDGNVARVLARVANDPLPVDDAAGRERMRARAQSLVDAGEDGAVINEGLMELGALVCTPRAPSCELCPWRASCAARAAATATSLPTKAPKKARKALRVASLVVVDGARVWLEKRAGGGLFGGLWEPPSTTIDAARDAPLAWRALLRARGLDLPKALPRPIVVERTLTHRDLTFYVMRVAGPASPSLETGAWIDDVAGVGTSTAVRAVLAASAPKGRERPIAIG